MQSLSGLLHNVPSQNMLKKWAARYWDLLGPETRWVWCEVDSVQHVKGWSCYFWGGARGISWAVLTMDETRGPPLPARDKRTIKAVETLSAFQDSQTGEVCGRGGVSLHLLGTKDVQLPGKGSLLKGPTLLIYWDRRKSRRFSMGICHDECSSDKTTLQWRCLPSMNAFHSPKLALSENSSPNVNSDDDVITAVGHLRE